MKNLVFIFVLLCVAAAPLQAQNVYQWFGAVSSNWLDGGNWFTELGLNPGTYGAVPDASAKTKINNVKWANIYEPVIGGINGTQNITVGDVFIAEAGAGLSPEYVHVETGGTFNVSGQINIAYQAGAVGGLIIDGGTVNVGTIHVGWGGTGLLSLNNGSLTANAFDIGGNLGSGHIHMTGNSQIIITGNYSPWDPIDPPIDGDPYTITYDEVNNKTIISTPEPASIALLGLGLVFLKKRK